MFLEIEIAIVETYIGYIYPYAYFSKSLGASNSELKDNKKAYNSLNNISLNSYLPFSSVMVLSGS
jgi:hypothetical protein